MSDAHELDRFEPISPSSVPVTPDENSNRGGSTASSPTTRSRGASGTGTFLRNQTRKFSTSQLPLGFFQASGQVVSSAPSLSDIQNGNIDGNGWSGVAQRRNSVARRDSDIQVLENIVLQRSATGLSASRKYSQPAIAEEPPPVEEDVPARNSLSVEKRAEEALDVVAAEKGISEQASTIGKTDVITPHDPSIPYPNGYQFPPKHTKKQSIKIGLRAYWRFLWTPFGFLLTLYSLNVVAWGGMLFLVLIGGAPAMCPPHAKYSCNSKHSSKNVWIENDSQIVNALFCVTGLGLIPWRFRDLYYLLQYRLFHNPIGLRRLAGINRDWFRLPNSQALPITWDPKTTPPPPEFPETTFAYPIEKTSDPPLTGERAPETKIWKLDFYIWCYVWNTFFQIMLCGVMWGLNRFNRPSWTTGCLIPVACVVAAAGGYVTAMEGRKVKKIEGVPVSEEDLEILRQMREKEREASGGETGEPPAFKEVTDHQGPRTSIEQGPFDEVVR